jgi:hypothetical protein
MTGTKLPAKILLAGRRFANGAQSGPSKKSAAVPRVAAKLIVANQDL